MGIRFKISVAHVALDAIAALFPSGAIAEVYAGTPPTDADTAIGAQTLLASATLAATAFNAASSRKITKNGTWQDSSANAGTATPPTFVRLKNAADTQRIDLDAGVGSGTANFDGPITAGQVVTFNAFEITA